MNHLTDTIIAPATPQGQSAIAIVRLSGKDAIAITEKIFKGKKLSEVDSHTIHYGWIVDGEKEIDEVMVSVFRAPKTFTTEDSTEISCHGSPQIVQAILSLAISIGARSADPGEFTLRAFLNGRIDLSQAEAVSDLIHATSSKSSEIALNQLRGKVSSTLKQLRQELIDFAALIELELDFSEEDVEFANRSRLKNLIHKIIKVIVPLLDSFRWGNSIKQGIPVAIIGPPNAGKSTLLNTILNEEKALVSDVAGTTRDFIEDTIILDGISFRFIDTAGIRETSDALESQGIERSIQKLREAEIVLYLSDVHRAVSDTIADFNKLNLSSTQSGFILLNKADTISTDDAENKVREVIRLSGQKPFLITAKVMSSVQQIFTQLNDYIKTSNQSEGTIINNSRHFEALQNTKLSLQRVLSGMDANVSSDLLTIDIREALYYLGTITGQVTTEDLLESIFSKFCIGK